MHAYLKPLLFISNLEVWRHCHSVFYSRFRLQFHTLFSVFFFFFFSGMHTLFLLLLSGSGQTGYWSMHSVFRVLAKLPLVHINARSPPKQIKAEMHVWYLLCYSFFFCVFFRFPAKLLMVHDSFRVLAKWVTGACIAVFGFWLNCYWCMYMHVNRRNKLRPKCMFDAYSVIRPSFFCFGFFMAKRALKHERIFCCM